MKRLSPKPFWKCLGKIFFYLILILLFFFLFSTVTQATGLVDNTIDNTHAYSRYPLENYQLDFYVDNSWNWLPWNWTDGIGQQVMYGLYAITSFIWMINLYLSNATGYLIQEAYALDFISDTADAIGKNIQTLAGVTPNGFANEGFYVGLLLFLILIIGIYISYVGLIKRETTKAIHAMVNFVVVFVLSTSFIAYAPDAISRINDFSADMSQASLSLGTRITLPHSEYEGSESVDLIRDSLFSVQVRQPWLLLQYGNSDEEALGEDRIEALLAISPNTNHGEDREQMVIEEIEERENAYLTVTHTINRLGTTVFILLFNIGISIFVFLLSGIMIFSQVLFIIYAMFLPISFLLSMIPTFEHTSKRALTRLFNAILARAGITLVLTIAFSISSMLYSLSLGYPFFLIAFLQIVTFAGIYFNLGNLMSMFALQSNDSQHISRRVMRRPRLFMYANMRNLHRKLKRSPQNTKKTVTTPKTANQQTKKETQMLLQNNSSQQNQHLKSRQSFNRTNRKKQQAMNKNNKPKQSPPVSKKSKRFNKQKEPMTISSNKIPQKVSDPHSALRSNQNQTTRKNNKPNQKRQNVLRKGRNNAHQKKLKPSTSSRFNRPSVQQNSASQKKKSSMKQLQNNQPTLKQPNRKLHIQRKQRNQSFKKQKRPIFQKKRPTHTVRRKDRKT